MIFGNKICEEIHKIYLNEPFLKVNNLLNNDLLSILKEFDFEFGEYEYFDSLKEESDNFWIQLEGFNKSLKEHIDSWKDISFVNQVEFQPYKFFVDDVVK